MQFSTITAAAIFLGANAVLAGPVHKRTSETISVTDFNVHQTLTSGNSTNAAVDGVYFTLNGDDATDLACQADTSAPSEVIPCGESDYSFALYPGASGSEFTLRLYHSLSQFAGLYGEGPIAVHCHAGGGQTLACPQVTTPINLIIDNDPLTHPVTPSA